MKRYARIFIVSTLVLFGPFHVKAQLIEYAIEDSTYKYDLEFKFTGEVLNSVDSVFTVSCIINESILENVSTVILKSGKTKDQLIEKRIEQTDFKNSLSVEGKVYFEIGTANEDLRVIEIMIIKEDNEIKLNHIRY